MEAFGEQLDVKTGMMRKWNVDRYGTRRFYDGSLVDI